MEELPKLIREHYALDLASLEPLDGYEDKTYRMVTGTGTFILKEHLNKPGLLERIALEARLMEHYASAGNYAFPKHLLTRKGAFFVLSGNRVYRILEYLDGSFLGDLPPAHRPFASWGRLLGAMSVKAREFTGQEQGLAPSPWDLQHLALHKAALQDSIADQGLAAAIAYFIGQFEAEVEPRRFELQKGFIHNDANEWNILAKNGEITGLIDFGDSCYSWVVNDLAVGLAYALMDQPDPLATARTVIGGYCAESTLTPLEADLLYYLIAGRLCMSLSNSALAKKDRPGSAYVAISEEPARRLLFDWLKINPKAASDTFRQAAGLPAAVPSDPASFQERRQRFFSPALSLSYRQPIVMERAAFQYMYAADGATFLDAYNNIMLVGHAHPHVVEKGCKAMRRLNTNTRYHYEALLSYAERLLARFPAPLNKVFFVNSGSAATDLALRLARWYTGNQKVAALESGYHGNTMAALAVSPYKHREGMRFPDTLVCPLPKAFGSGLADNGSAGAHFGAECREILQRAGSLAAFIAEPVVGCGGQVPLPAGYLKTVYPAVRALGGVCISDEVQVGFGRLGSHFWGFEMQGVVPDIVVLGKPMGNGHPLGAVVCTEPIAEAFARGPEFFSSFGGNPVSCAIGQAVLEVIDREGLQAHAAGVGQYLIRGFRDLQANYPHIADVRGSGLFLGVEFAHAGGAPATDWARAVKEGLRQGHVLVGTDGPHDNVLKIKPPLPFDRNNSDEVLDKIEAILKGIGFI